MNQVPGKDPFWPDSYCIHAVSYLSPSFSINFDDIYSKPKISLASISLAYAPLVPSSWWLVVPGGHPLCGQSETALGEPGVSRTCVVSSGTQLLGGEFHGPMFSSHLFGVDSQPRLFGYYQNKSWRGKWQPTPVFLPGEFHGRGSLAGCSSRG